MGSEDKELTQEELEAQAGQPLPAREVMSLLTTNPGVIAIPEDPTVPADPARTEPAAPPPGHDV